MTCKLCVLFHYSPQFHTLIFIRIRFSLTPFFNTLNHHFHISQLCTPHPFVTVIFEPLFSKILSFLLRTNCTVPKYTTHQHATRRTPRSAGSPPARPQGRKARRSERTLTVSAFRNVISRETPSPPRLAPSPPEPRRSPNEFSITGYLRFACPHNKGHYSSSWGQTREGGRGETKGGKVSFKRYADKNEHNDI